MLNKKIKFIVFAAIISLTFSCSDDEEPAVNMMMEENCDNANVSYQNDIVPILNAACALSGCHVESFNAGDFTLYGPLKDRVDSGRLNSRVVVSQNMPPSNSSGPKSLSDEEIKLFECWIEAGGPDN